MAPLLARLPFYHTGAEIRGRLRAMAARCEGASMSLERPEGAELDVAVVRPRGGTALRGTGRGEGLRAMLIFGEHARELISAESGLHLLRALCEKGGEGGGRRLPAGVAELRVVVNANPAGRRAVEGGEWCRRTNEDLVDLNRNWDDEFVSNRTWNGSARQNPGAAAFSEPETRALRAVAADLRPHLFLTVHSGALGLGSPFGHSREAPRGAAEEGMLRVLGQLADRYCDCPTGPISDIVGYTARGDAIDYAFTELGVPFASTWEIYADNGHEPYYHQSRQLQRARESELHAIAQERAQLEAMGTPALLQHRAGERDDDCLSKYNPVTASGYSAVLGTWTAAYLDLLAVLSGGLSAQEPWLQGAGLR